MKALIAVSLVSVLAGCAVAPHSASVYTGYQTQNEQSVRMATVESIRDVTIVNRNSGTGTMAGAALGGIAAGSNVGGGNGSVAAGIVGAVAGGLIGQSVEANMNNRRGYEITVKLDNGELRAITQEADELFRPGERVRLLSNGRSTRVTH
ncbi:MAG: glycine zipper 2TM domain-containing protein [Pseudomonadota bacterium]